MIVAGRGAALGAANPLLCVYVLVAGALAAAVSVAWTVNDVSDDDKLLSPVQVATGTVNLTADRLTDLPAGHYALAWTVPAQEPLGRHEVRWVVTTAAGSYSVREEFDVAVGALNGFRAYALPSDLRDEGVDATVTEARIQRALMKATADVEKYTSRLFGPRVMTLAVDGNGRQSLRLDQPLDLLVSASYAGDGPLDLTGVYYPNEPSDPRVLLRSGSWRRGRGNVSLFGVFGYVEPDPDGSPLGAVPLPIREVTWRLALLSLPRAVSEADDADDGKTKHRIASLTTRDQSVSYVPDDRLAGSWPTGIPDIDQVIADYSAPPFVGST